MHDASAWFHHLSSSSLRSLIPAVVAALGFRGAFFSAPAQMALSATRRQDAMPGDGCTRAWPQTGSGKGAVSMHRSRDAQRILSCSTPIISHNTSYVNGGPCAGTGRNPIPFTPDSLPDWLQVPYSGQSRRRTIAGHPLTHSGLSSPRMRDKQQQCQCVALPSSSARIRCGHEMSQILGFLS